MSSCQEIGNGPSKGGAFDRAIASKFGRYNIPEKGAHKGCPYGWIGGAREGEGTHKGRPYGWIGVPARGRAPTRGAPTVG